MLKRKVQDEVIREEESRVVREVRELLKAREYPAFLERVEQIEKGDMRIMLNS